MKVARPSAKRRMGRLRLRSKAGRKASHDSDGGDDLIKKKNFKELGVTYASIDPFDPRSFGYMQIGTIVGPHGVKGEVKSNGHRFLP